MDTGVLFSVDPYSSNEVTDAHVVGSRVRVSVLMKEIFGELEDAQV